MSITVKTGKTNSDYFAVTKTVTDETERTISIVYPCDILAPTVSIKGGQIDANYLIGLFGRKSWISNQTVDKGITYLHCNVDAWASWSSNIYSSTQFVDRSETKGNENINDGVFPLPNSNKIEILDSNTTIITGDFTYLLGVI